MRIDAAFFAICPCSAGPVETSAGVLREGSRPKATQQAHVGSYDVELPRASDVAITVMLRMWPLRSDPEWVAFQSRHLSSACRHRRRRHSVAASILKRTLGVLTGARLQTRGQCYLSRSGLLASSSRSVSLIWGSNSLRDGRVQCDASFGYHIGVFSAGFSPSRSSAVYIVTGSPYIGSQTGFLV